jgi:hypothetical protein
MGNNCGIVVLGVPRSGTTLVRRLLNAHPNIACPGETCMLSACARFLHSETVAGGLEFGVINGLSFAGFTEDEILDRLRTLAFGFHIDYAQSQGKKRWAEKTAIDIFHLEGIEKLCADQVQYVCVVRHGLDVICSLKEFSDRGFTYLSEVHEYIKQHPIELEAFAHAWVDANQSLLKFIDRHPDKTHLIRYEDLVGKSKSETKSMFKFLNEKSDEKLISTALARPRQAGLGDWKTYQRNEINKASIGRWKGLPSHLVSRLAEICNPTLEAFGYETIKIKQGDKQSVARRRYEFAMLFGSNKDNGDTTSSG